MKKTLLMILLSLSLTACGGGGGSDEKTSTPVDPTPVDPTPQPTFNSYDVTAIDGSLSDSSSFSVKVLQTSIPPILKLEGSQLPTPPSIASL